jgi:hypothetical protein
MYTRFLTAKGLTGILHHSFAAHLLLKCVTISKVEEQFDHKNGERAEKPLKTPFIREQGEKQNIPKKKDALR